MRHARTIIRTIHLLIIMITSSNMITDAFGMAFKTSSKNSNKMTSSDNNMPEKHFFSIPLALATEQEELLSKENRNTFSESFSELWNDKRSITSVIRDNNNNDIKRSENNNNGSSSSNSNDLSNNTNTILPYCIKSEQLNVNENNFQILLYSRGIFSSSSSISKATSSSAYLSFLPKQYGDEIDLYWKIKLYTKNTNTNTSLPILTSGGLPKSNDTFISAMTFCSKNEAVDSVGRTNDWGSSVWNSQDVCDALLCNSLYADIDIWVYDVRTGESMWSWPPKGSTNAVLQRVREPINAHRTFRVGEVIVPLPSTNSTQTKKLQSRGIYPGIDYRVMTIADANNNALFTTIKDDRAKLALRPTGWKLQQKLWKTRGFRDWPIEIDTHLLTEQGGVSSRYNIQAFFPRFKATLLQETRSLMLALLLALSPIFVASIAREFVSLYAIPSASMEPTLLKGDVLLVEKFPNIYDRIQRGNIILFNPPPALEAIMQNSNYKKKGFGPNALFVKRVVGMPGDANIIMNKNDQEMIINDMPAVGPNRNLCDDEPLKLIDKLLLEPYGKGTHVPRLNDNELFVLGDCKAVSVDSRVFGILKKEYIVGKPIGRIWPLSRFTFGQL